MLRLILGRAGSGKSRLCLEEIKSRLQEDVFSFSPLLYIIPEQASFQAEYALASASPRGGSVRAQVFTFKRLAWKVMQERGEKEHLFIDDTGKSMLLLKILEMNKQKLKVFKHSAEQPGSLKNLLRLYNEMRRYCLTSSNLEDLLGRQGGDHPLLRDKLADLAVIMKDMEVMTEGHYIDGEGTLSLLLKNIPVSEFLQRAEFWVDGFYHFTRLEEQILESLIKVTKGVTITFCLDGEQESGGAPPQENLFYSSAYACRRLQETASQSGFSVEKIVLSGEKGARFAHNPVLSHLEKNLDRFPGEPFPGELFAAEQLVAEQHLTAPFAPLNIMTAQNRRVEVEAVGRKIISLAREHGYRWRDMAILISNLEDYRRLLTSVLHDYEIPFFLDQERMAAYHPLPEFIRSALEIITRGWRRESVFRCFKTEFLYPFALIKERHNWRLRVSRLENYVLACGIQGNSWTNDEPWRYALKDDIDEEWSDTQQAVQKKTEQALSEQAMAPEETFVEDLERAEIDEIAEINETRFLLAAPLADFQKAFREAATVREKVLALFNFLEGAAVRDRLEFWIREDLAAGELEKSREHNQVYNGVINLLEQLVEMMGESPISAAQFCRILEAGFESLSLSLLPPSLDQVMVGNIERTRPGEIRCAFILGANEGILPPRIQEEGVLEEEERQVLEKLNLVLAPGVQRQLLEQQFHIYMALTRPASLLFVSCPRSDEEGRALLPSLVITRLKEIFPALREEFLQPAPASPQEDKGEQDENYLLEISPKTPSEELFHFLGRPRQVFSLLAAELSRWKEGGRVLPLWWDVYNWFAVDRQWQREGAQLLRGIFYQNRENPLPQDLSRSLYGNQWKAGVSRLERYRACPFSQFLSHGLKLEEREFYRLEHTDRGRFFHTILGNVTGILQREKIDFADLDEETAATLVDEQVAKLLPRLGKKILLSSNRYAYLAGRLEKTVNEALLRIVEHHRRSDFKPIGAEIPFGGESAIPGLKFELGEGRFAEVVGRIDRVDLAWDKAGGLFLRVIDYKSGAVDLLLDEVVHGLALQLPVYLDIMLAASGQLFGESALPAGMFYFRIHAPFINTNGEWPPNLLAEERLKQYKMKGRSLADAEVIRLMDNLLLAGYSPLIPVGLSKEGNIYQNSAVLSLGEFSRLREHARFLLGETVEEIIRGGVAISPSRLGKNKACTFCAYKAVCQFDPALAENKFRILARFREEDLWNLRQRRDDI